METLSIHAAQGRLREVVKALVEHPAMTVEFSQDLERVFCTLRDHVYFLDYQKRALDELRAELDLA